MPRTARCRSACLALSLPRARSASSVGSVTPLLSASTIARPDSPSTRVATEASFTLAPLQDLLDTVAFCGAFSDQRLSIAHQLTQLTLGATRHEARFQEPMAQQIRDPLGVFDVRLLAGDRFHMLRVDHQQLEGMSFKNIVDGLPKYASTLHSHVGDVALLKPGGHRLQVLGHRAERPNRSPPPTEDARDNHALMHVQTATSLMHHLHALPPPVLGSTAAGAAAAILKTSLRPHPVG